MKRLILLTTALLLSLTARAQDPRPFARAAPHPTVTPCELARAPERYDGETVRLVGRAYWRAGASSSLRVAEAAGGRCGAEEAVRVVVPEQSSGVSGPFAELDRKASASHAARGGMTAEVEVVGRFDKGAKGLTDCFGPRFSIKARSVRRLSPAAPSFLE